MCAENQRVDTIISAPMRSATPTSLRIHLARVASLFLIARVASLFPITFTVPASNIWVKMWIDPQSKRIVKETIIDPGHRIEHILTYSP